MLFTKMYFVREDFEELFGASTLDREKLRRNSSVKRSAILCDLEAVAQQYVIERGLAEEVFFPLSARSADKYFRNEPRASGKGLSSTDTSERKEAFSTAYKPHEVCVCLCYCLRFRNKHRLALQLCMHVDAVTTNSGEPQRHL